MRFPTHWRSTSRSFPYFTVIARYLSACDGCSTLISVQTTIADCAICSGHWERWNKARLRREPGNRPKVHPNLTSKKGRRARPDRNNRPALLNCCEKQFKKRLNIPPSTPVLEPRRKNF